MYTTHITVGGMTCSACTGAVTDTLQGLDGVRNADVSLITEEATVVHDGSVKPEQLSDAIEDIGFEATLVDTEESKDSEELFETRLGVGGMTCSACVNAVTDALTGQRGVKTAEVSLITEEATVTHTGESSPAQLAEAIEDCGFEGSVKSSAKAEPKDGSLARHGRKDEDSEEKATLRISGMTCSNCSNTIEEQVGQLEGVKSCNVALATEEAVVVFDSDKVGIRDIIERIDDSGFEATVANSLDISAQLDLLAKVKDIDYWRTNFIKLLCFGIPIILLGNLYPLILKIVHQPSTILEIGHGLYFDTLLQFALGTYVQFWLGHRFYRNAYKSLMHLSGTMDMLICISTSIAYIYSVVAIVVAFVVSSQTAPRMLFDTSAMLFTFVTIGKWAESKAKGNTSTALSQLLSLTPSSCIIVENPSVLEKSLDEKKQFNVADVEQRRIGAELLQKGDIAVVLPGATVPTDGVCIFGHSEVDESLLTGESMPVPKAVGSPLIGGSVNATSTMYMRVERVGEKTQLQQIVKLVRDAQVGKAPVQRLADVIASKFVPAVLTLSLFTFVFWCIYVTFHPIRFIPAILKDTTDTHVVFSKILEVTISVIVVACPCALGLAAPTAVMVGTGAGATNGVLIKGGEILERASGIDTIVFDKTGTLTAGKMRLAESRFYGPYSGSEAYLWSILKAIEQHSEHPVATAIAKGAGEYLEEEGTEIVFIEDIETRPGEGVLATESGRTVKVGSGKFVSDSPMSNIEDFNDALERLSQNAVGSVSHILIGKYYCGYVVLQDFLKSDAIATVTALKDYGYSVAMVTGDNAPTARVVATTVGIPLTNVLAESRPEKKLEYVAGLQELGRKTAFVGDGINDAPALVQSDLGIAISSGTDVAMSAADVVVLSSSGPVSDDFEVTADIADGSHVAGVFHAIDISRRTLRVIHMNFLLAVIYNFVMLPLAMGLLIIPYGITFHPMLASAAMACSSVSVVMNSLRLKRWVTKDLVSEYSGVSPFNADPEKNSTSNLDITKTEVTDFVPNTIGRRGRSLVTRIRSLVSNASRKGEHNSYEMLPTNASEGL